MLPTRRSAYARARTKSNATPLTLELQRPPSQQQQQQSFASPSTSTLAPAKQEPMSPSSRYLHNLRVIQRHDPTITSLFDQFPHVCVYHHKGDEWQKKGCEGAMFLFEREEEPKYGFYILNRNNTGDYIQRLTPDDDVELANAYLIYRAYGKVTSDTIGLWTMVTHDREAMSQVMMRLHSYVRRGERYPDIYRRKPETWSTTPAPAHAHAQTQFVPQLQLLPQTPTHLYSQPHLQFQFPLQSSPYPLPASAQQPPSGVVQPDLSSSISSFDNLIAKLDNNNHTKSTAPSSSPYLQTSTRSGVRLNSKAPDRAISASVPPPKAITGIPLLDSIFASASNPTPSNGLLSTTPAYPPFPNLTPPTSTLQPRVNGIGHSPSSSSGVTPTQPISELPRSMSPSKSKKPPSSSPLVSNGIRSGQGLNVSMRGVLPFPSEKSSRAPHRYGRESAPPGKGSVLNITNGASIMPILRRNSAQQYPPQTSIPEAREEEPDEVAEAENVGNANMGVGFHGVRSKGRKEKKREDGKAGELRSTPPPQQSSSTQNLKDSSEWALVDDRSLSVDESEEGEVSGLGDGLLDAIATFSESDAHISTSGVKAESKVKGRENSVRGSSCVVNGNGVTTGMLNARDVSTTATTRNTTTPSRSSNVNGVNGRGRRKRKQREQGEGVINGPVFFSSANKGSTTINGAGTSIANGSKGAPALTSGGTRSTSSLHMHNLNLNTNISSYSYSSSTPGFPEIARAPSSSSASSRSHPLHHHHHSRSSVGIMPVSIVPTPEIRNTLAQTYGSRRNRAAGDAVILSEKELKAEIVHLINNDPTFMKELYQDYLCKVKV